MSYVPEWHGLGLWRYWLSSLPRDVQGVQGCSGSDLGLIHPGVCEWSWMNVEMKLGFF